ncbi:MULTISPECIES: hypothetical protein [unclassified Burkholderia]|uniref:hypothetical protein n=1 Tax=unclassified Burkholderia TaxID=2613784 RepID=UPI000F55D17E|nr:MULTISPECIES: hypothetical protein [unclassified Burkholderia]RQR87748.1 hypothetical protein DIE10_06590 [Burkholderia sp. Bp9011]RQR97091.1 hypothetical protein DIE09_06765 [Burkholderia sp. Bp9010]
MKKLFAALAAGLAVPVLFAGCANAPVNPAMLKTQVVKACTVFQPVSASVEAMYAIDPKLMAVGAGLRGLCAAQDAIDPTSVVTLVNSTIPAALAALKGAAGLPGDQVKAVSDALLIANIALSAGLAAYGPAVAPVAASTPLAGAPLK